MDLIHAVILGIVEGVTEYLPISSTFHLIWASKLLQLENTEFLKLFDVFIQSGAILAVVVLYFKTLISDWKTVKKIAVSFIPTALIGFTLYKVIKEFFFENAALQLTVFALVGVLFIVYEKYVKKSLKRSVHDLSYQQALIIGLCQSFAIVPGVSRAGSVMLAMLAMNIKRSEAAKYSFLLATPTLFAAAGLDLFKSRELLMANMSQVGLLATGFVAAFISAYLVMRWFISYMEKNDLSVFGWYRLVVVAIALLAGL